MKCGESSSSLSDPPRCGDAINRDVVRLDGKFQHDLAIETQSPARSLSPHSGQETVVVAAAASQAVAAAVKCQSWDQCPIHLRDIDLNATVTRLWNSQNSWLEVVAQR